jgi:DNA polymerase I
LKEGVKLSEYIPEYLQDEPVMDSVKEDIKYIPIGYQYINDTLCLLTYNTNTDNITIFPKDKDHNPYILSRDTVIKSSKGIIRVVNMDKFVATKGVYQPFKQVVLVTPNDATYISKKLRTAWENHIRYHECYVYDKQLVFGVPAENKEGSLVPTFRFQGDLKEYLDKILSIEFIPIRRCALDIEVRKIGGKFADPETAEFPIIDFSIVGNDGKSWLLFTGPKAYKLGSMECFVEEATMVRRGFEIVEKEGYPIILTKNGDGYDFPYLANRCLKIGVPCPIFQKLKFWSWNNKIHIDIERFFGNSTIKKEIFKNRYDDNSLEELVEKLLVGKRKLASPDFENDRRAKIAVEVVRREFERTLTSRRSPTAKRSLNRLPSMALRMNLFSKSGKEPAISEYSITSLSSDI